MKIETQLFIQRINEFVL